MNHAIQEALQNGDAGLLALQRAFKSSKDDLDSAFDMVAMHTSHFRVVNDRLMTEVQAFQTNAHAQLQQVTDEPIASERRAGDERATSRRRASSGERTTSKQTSSGDERAISERRRATSAVSDQRPATMTKRTLARARSDLSFLATSDSYEVVSGGATSEEAR